MKLTKEDYMRLPKERLAELLVEMDNEKVDPIVVPSTPSIPIMPTQPSGWGCDGVHCTNPQMDCINCPRTLHYRTNTKSYSVGDEKEEKK